MLFVRILAQVLAAIALIVVAALDYHWHDKRTKRFKQLKGVLFGLLGGCLIASIWLAIYDEDQHAIEVAALTRDLRVLATEAAKQGFDAQRRDTVTQQRLSDLIETNGQLQKRLTPFEQLADRLFSGTPPQQRLGLLEQELAHVSQRTQALETRAAGRRIPTTAFDAIRHQLSRYSGQTLRIDVLGGDAEAMRFASDIDSCFQQAGISIPQLPSLIISPDTWSGLVLEVPSTAPQGFAEALAGALRLGGHSVQVVPRQQGITILRVGSQK